MLRRRPRTGSAPAFGLGLPARYSGARIGPVPPTRGIVARVAHLPVRAFVEPTVVAFPAAAGSGSVTRLQRAPRPLRFAFFSRLSYWWDIRCAWICAMKSITTTTTISSEVPPK